MFDKYLEQFKKNSVRWATAIAALNATWLGAVQVYGDNLPKGLVNGMTVVMVFALVWAAAHPQKHVADYNPETHEVVEKNA